MSAVRVLALHVHHGLSPHADEWMAHCEAQCSVWADAGLPVDFVAERLTERPASGDSPEAWARTQRYRVLTRLAVDRSVDLILLAHHRRDQAETVLLQALRGAGVAGLAGMPKSAFRNGITWLRPWLERSRDDIDAYLRSHDLRFIEDESNADRRLARSRLRVHVWPALVGAFPRAEASLATAAAWAHEADAALRELAAADLSNLAVGPRFDLTAWSTLSSARRSLALRTWLAGRAGAPVPASLVGRLVDELPASRSGARWPFGAGELRRHGRILTHVPGAVLPLPATDDAAPAARVDPADRGRSPGEAASAVVAVRRAGLYLVPGWPGRLRVTRVKVGGVPLAWLGRLDVCPRRGGEQFQSAPNRPPRSLKKQFQAADVPAWARDGPLFYSGGQLVFVPGLGIDARVIGLPDTALVLLQWLPHEPSPGGEPASEPPGGPAGQRGPRR